ncbi:SapC protein [Sinobacterium caligoides]|uniref:SapC protein n=1 Tax=Sinobacterium caligoides TaxID=933926 RepID=A0A3N2DJH2_9GAMM|nr:SapC family protein [Sinobacterium caligoides]ROR99935.1 SapC protein [Sinobacterium caligoides]
MSKQMLIYNNAKPLSTQRHLDWSIKVDEDYSFASQLNSLPLTAVEFANAADEFPIVFAGKGDQLMPVAVLGLRDAQNLFTLEDGRFDAAYVPAFLRRYPFVFASANESGDLTLCLDEAFKGCNTEGKGERLFDSEGERTSYLNKVLEFLKEYQSHYAKTQNFCQKLVELDLLEPMGAEITPAGSDEKIQLGGFMAVNRGKLKGLGDEAIKELFTNDGLELIYTHLASMRNFKKLVNKLPSTVAAA